MKNILVQENIFTEDQFELTNVEAASKYFNVQVLNLTDFYSNKINPHNYFRTSIGVAVRMNKLNEWTNTLNYIPYLRKYYLTNSFVFDSLDHFIEKFQGFPAFIRPASGKKEFSGGVYSKDELEIELKYLQSKNIDKEIIVFAAKPVDIKEEYRTIFINGKYISGSRYIKNDEIGLSSNIPDSVVEFSKVVSGHSFFQNKFNFIIDIAIKRSGEPSLVEINQFETSSFYLADLDKIYYHYANS